MNDDYSGRQTVYSDAANDRDTGIASIDYVSAADRYVTTFDVQSGGASFVRIYFHDGGVGNARPGGTVDLNPSGVHAYRTPSFGGNAGFSAPTGYLACRRDLRSARVRSERRTPTRWRRTNHIARIPGAIGRSAIVPPSRMARRSRATSAADCGCCPGAFSSSRCTTVGNERGVDGARLLREGVGACRIASRTAVGSSHQNGRRMASNSNGTTPSEHGSDRPSTSSRRPL